MCVCSLLILRLDLRVSSHTHTVFKLQFLSPNTHSDCVSHSVVNAHESHNNNINNNKIFLNNISIVFLIVIIDKCFWIIVKNKFESETKPTNRLLKRKEEPIDHVPHHMRCEKGRGHYQQRFPVKTLSHPIM